MTDLYHDTNDYIVLIVASIITIACIIILLWLNY